MRINTEKRIVTLCVTNRPNFTTGINSFHSPCVCQVGTVNMVNSNSTIYMAILHCYSTVQWLGIGRALYSRSRHEHHDSTMLHNRFHYGVHYVNWIYQPGPEFVSIDMLLAISRIISPLFNLSATHRSYA